MSRLPARRFARLSIETLEDRCTPAAGELDVTFGVDGVARHKLVQSPETILGEVASEIKRGPSGKIYVAGTLTTLLAGGEYRDQILVRRLNLDGSLDREYADRVALVDLDLEDGRDFSAFSAMAVDGQGRVLLAGWIQTPAGGYDMALVRIASDGTVDRNFGDNGRAIIWFDMDDVLPHDYVRAVAIDGLGRIVVAGNSYTASGSVWVVARLTPAGDRDTTFGRPDKPGRQWIDFSGPGPDQEQYLSGLAIDSSNRIVLGGSARGPNNRDFAAARLTTSGKLDLAFADDGTTTVDIGQGNGEDYVAGLSLGPGGTIVLAGDANAAGGDPTDPSHHLAAVRLRADGSPDPSFGVNGRMADMSRSFYLRESAVDAAGQTVLLGQTTPSASDVVIVRLGANGSYDTTFGSGGIADLSPLPGDNGTAVGRGITLDTQGNILFAAEPGSPYEFLVAKLQAGVFAVGTPQTFTVNGNTFQATTSNKQTLLYRAGTTGTWTEVTGVTVKSISILVSGTTVHLIVLGTGGKLHARAFVANGGVLNQNGGWFHFDFAGKTVATFSTATTATGRFQVFAITADRSAYNSIQSSAGAKTYNTPVAFAGTGFTDVRNHRRQDGRIAVFFLMSSGVVKRSLANGLSTDRFTAFPTLAAPGTGVAVKKLSSLELINGRLVLTVIGSNGVKYKTTETAANSNTYSAWVVV